MSLTDAQLLAEVRKRCKDDEGLLSKVRGELVALDKAKAAEILEGIKTKRAKAEKAEKAESDEAESDDIWWPNLSIALHSISQLMRHFATNGEWFGDDNYTALGECKEAMQAICKLLDEMNP